MSVDQLPDFSKCSEVAALSCGAKILFASDDFFAAAECMLQDTDPIFIAEKFTDYGKWMDGWETRRKRIAGHDFCIIRLAGPTSIKGFLIDTAHFTGNYVPKISIQAATLPPSADGMAPGRKPYAIGRAPSNRDFDKIARLKSNEWTTIVPMTDLQPGYEKTRHTYIHNTQFQDKYTHLRLNLHPDGGIARFKVYGDIELEPATEANVGNVIDMLSLQNGGRCLSYSNAHFGHPRNLIKPGRATSMMDGWETARRLDRPPIIEMVEKDVFNIPGTEWAIFRLATTATVVSIEVDTNHFKGNAPDYVTIEGTMRRDDSCTDFNENEWTVIIEKMRLQPHKQHSYKREIKNIGPYNCVRITIAPDGGLSRIRILGHRFIEKPVEEAANATTIAETESELKTEVETKTKTETENGTENGTENKTMNKTNDSTPANETNNSKDETTPIENNQEQHAENGCD